MQQDNAIQYGRIAMRLIVMFAMLTVSSIFTAPVRAQSSPSDGPFRVTFNAQGLSQITYQGQALLPEDASVRRQPCSLRGTVILRSYDGVRVAPAGAKEERPHGHLPGPPTERQFDPDTRTLTVAYPWMELTCRYTVRDDRLEMRIEITNTSRHIIDKLHLNLVTLRLDPDAQTLVKTDYEVEKTDGRYPLIQGRFASGEIALVNDRIGRDLGLHIERRPKDSDQYHARLFIGEGHGNFHIDRSIHPGQTDRYTLSLRVGPKDDRPLNLVGDLVERMRAVYPSLVDWPDRRPIGRIMVARRTNRSGTNPRGYLMDESVDITTDEGLASFHKRFIDWAEKCVENAKRINAQGVIVWDLGGKEYPPANYYGEPRKLPKEIRPVVDEFFATFREAGLRTGVLLRWDRRPFRWHYDNQPIEGLPNAEQIGLLPVSDPVEFNSRKIEYAKERWGCELFYVDANNRTEFRSIRALARRHPDVLIIPEHAVLYEFGAGPELHTVARDKGKAPFIPEHVRTVYPNTFRVMPRLGLLDEQALRRSMRQGNVPMAPVFYSPGKRYEKIRRAVEQIGADKLRRFDAAGK